MSRGPRRLMDDPDFQWETGCNLRDESVLTEGYDLGSLREAVLARVPEVGDGVPPIRPRRGWRWGVGGLVGLSTVTAFWLGTQFGGLDLETPANPEAPPAAAPTPVEPDAPTTTAPAIEEAAAPMPLPSAPPVTAPAARRVSVEPDSAAAPTPSVGA
ncbi:MAG: hypothetical protein AAF602_09655, partial [Myxococcota bacterium]